MANRAVSKSRGTQIVESGRDYSERGPGVGGVRQIRMALQANQPDFLPDQHTRIRGPVRLMTRPAALKSHGRVLECEGSALIPVAFEAAWLVCREGLHHTGPEASMRVVAIHARHGVLSYAVFERPLKLRHYILMATGALLIYRSRLARDQPERSVRVDLMTGGARHQISGVAALDAAGVRRPVQMAHQTRAVGLRRRKLRWITNIRGGRRFRVLRSRPMTRFAGLFHPVVRVLLESVPDLFVARQACLRAHIARLLSPRAYRQR